MGALREWQEITLGLEAIRDRLATTLYRLTLETHWIVPDSHRPTCPLSGKPCTSWTCLLDTCTDGGDLPTECKAGQALIAEARRIEMGLWDSEHNGSGEDR
jgi:hypothetical protein